MRVLTNNIHRGPAKGYIEGLEHRLHDAELLLLQLLPYVSTEQLQIASSALLQDGNESGRDSPDRRSSPPVLNKKTGIEYWENFPLTSAAAIRKWQQDCELNGAGNSNSIRPELQARGSSPGSQHLSAADNLRQKRPSLPGSHPSTSFPSDDGDASLSGMFQMQNVRRASGQTTSISPQQRQRQEQMTMAMSQSQRGSPWQTPPQVQAQMMNMTRSHSDITQTQTFADVGYLNASVLWSHQQNHVQQQSMPMDLDHHGVSQDSIPIMTSQTHSHLFW